MRSKGKLAGEYRKTHSNFETLVFSLRLLGLDISRNPVEDEEIWRSTEEGKHFKVESSTGEIKAGFGGKFNGKKLGTSWKTGGEAPKPPKVPEAQKQPKTPETPKPAVPHELAEFQSKRAWNGISNIARSHKGDYKGWIKGLDSSQRELIENQRKQCGTKESSTDYAKRIFQMLSETKPVPRPENKPVNGGNILDGYKYEGPAHREGTLEIDTEIEDAIHKQGYDGVPRVVSQAEFDNIVKQNPQMPILFRSYTADDADQLQDFDEMLESGFFYVDCGVGGAQYGQGMYCAGCYTPELNRLDDLKQVKWPYMFKSNKGEAYVIQEKMTESDIDNGLYPDETYVFVDSTGKRSLIHYDFDSLDAIDVNTGEVVSDFDGMIEGAQEIWRVDRDKKSDVSRDALIEAALKEMSHYRALGRKRATEEWEKSGKEKPFTAQCSTRMMTLDPSAKIVNYRELRTEVDDLRRGGFESGMEQKDFRNALLEKINPEEADREMYKDMADRCYLYMTQTATGKNTTEEAIHESVTEESFYALMSLNATSEDAHKNIQKVADMMRRVEEVMGEMPWTRKEPVKNMPRDLGVVAALLGYDAINAEGHGESESYTVVLNRTKVILSEERVNVD